ncbi:MAG: alpha/beta hydrolase [Ponticaulis sp.]|nr:alpha/beta hydrolase [Ponticaulis sp.]
MKVRPISLALQGGGAHGAFTWGVLDYLLEEGSLDFKAITATSAGAMNAIALVAGYIEDGRDGARRMLAAFWRDVSERGATLAATKSFHSSLGSFSPFSMLSAFSTMASPYDFNPFDFNPLQNTLENLIDFESIRKDTEIQLFISATDISTGKVRVFRTEEMTKEAVLASACLPQIFQAVSVNGTDYWDGGYVGNPSLFPLFYADVPKDMLIVHINPMHRMGTPKTAAAILDRLNEITFNASLVSELRSIAFVQKLIDENWLTATMQRKYKRMNIHAIRADDHLNEYSIETKFDTNWSFLTELRNRGREEAALWVAAHRRKVGKSSSVDIKSEFLDSSS